MVQHYGRSQFQHLFANQLFEFSRMNAKGNWNLELIHINTVLKFYAIQNSDELATIIDDFWTQGTIETIGSRLQLIHSRALDRGFIAKQLVITATLPSDSISCPLRLILRSFADLTDMSGFIHRDQISAITFAKPSHDRYLYGWALKNYDSEVEVIETLRLAMTMFVSDHHWIRSPYVIRIVGGIELDDLGIGQRMTEDMGQCVASIDQIVSMIRLVKNGGNLDEENAYSDIQALLSNHKT